MNRKPLGDMVAFPSVHADMLYHSTYFERSPVIHYHFPEVFPPLAKLHRYQHCLKAGTP